jgi:hypothetical protein
MGLLLGEHIRRSREDDLGQIFEDLEEYERIYSSLTGRELGKARIFELGYGARPNRLIAMISLGLDAYGVDLDAPMLDGGLSELTGIYRRNGLERALKSAARHVLFDRLERRKLQTQLRRRGSQITYSRERFLVGDAATTGNSVAPVDLIVSEDVLEHIPAQSLPAVISTMRSLLSEHGIALVRPNVFTGITGGHLVEWFPQNMRDRIASRGSEPWEHLRKRRYQPDTYLNGLSRRQFRELFQVEFDILEEKVKDPDLGREFLTKEIRDELLEYPDEELFSNQVLFVLRPKGQGAETAH